MHNRGVSCARASWIAIGLIVSAVAACGAKQPGSAVRPRVIVEGTSILIVSDDDENLPIEIPFRVDSATLEPTSHGALDALAGFLGENDDLTLIEVQGHSDERGTREYNIELSRRRAEAVIAYLVGRGVDRSRLRSRGFGADHPAARGAGESAWSQNRRVEIIY